MQSRRARGTLKAVHIDPKNLQYDAKNATQQQVQLAGGGRTKLSHLMSYSLMTYTISPYKNYV